MRSKEWTLLAVVPGGVIADQLKEVLEGEGIPVLIQDELMGSVTLVRGMKGARVRVHVPTPALEEAREIVRGIVPDEDTLPMP
ncbi:MAG: DUF2007 domain-containing protein [bacterium]